MGRTVRSFSFDAKKEIREKSKKKMKASSTAERNFARQLKKVAKASGHIVEAHADGAHLINEKAMMKALESYSKTIEPWAKKQATTMLHQVSKTSKRKFQNRSIKINEHLERVAQSNVGFEAMELLNEQVDLIKSIPIEAGLRAQDISARHFIEGTRALPDPEIIEELKKQMGMSTEVAVNRARLIARTETSRANSSFVETRAKAIGAQGYIWRTTMDGAERESHAEMNGKYVDYASPPKLSDGTTGHAGTFPNCRCYQDPVLPED